MRSWKTTFKVFGPGLYEDQADEDTVYFRHIIAMARNLLRLASIPRMSWVMLGRALGSVLIPDNRSASFCTIHMWG